MPTRHERVLQEQERARQKQRQRIILIGAGVLAALALLGVVVFASGAFNPSPAPSNRVAEAAASGTLTCGKIQTFATQTRDHIKQNQPHPAYSSNPPTSGWHWDNPQDWGIYTSPQVQEQLVHNLEHGGIVVQYNNLGPADVQRLADLVKRDSHHMILAPYPDLPADAKVALTAWDHLQTCTGVDETALSAFVSAYRDKGPELVP
jgi:hypothetical protein